MSRPLPGDEDYCDDCDGICDQCHGIKPPKTKEQRDEEDIQRIMKVILSRSEHIQREVIKQVQEALNKNKN